ncbi:MAG: type I restriction enzyme S subunit [Cognaticolwellia sp.]|jgi:type I restriction enzyme S subunit
MGSDFVTSKLSDIVERVCVGFVGACNKDYTTRELGVPMIRTTNLTGNNIRYEDLKFVTEEFHLKNLKSQLKRGHILVARHGDNGLPSIYESDENANCLNVVIIKPYVNDEYIDNYYLLYALRTPYVVNQVKSSVGGSVQGVVNTKAIANLDIPFPERVIRKQIVNQLKTLNDKIELNKQTNQTLVQMAQSLFKSWFVDFDPVFDNLLAKVDFDLAKLPSDFPDVLLKRMQKRLLFLSSEVGAVTKIKASQHNTSINCLSTADTAVSIHQNFPNEFEHNEQLGWIPKGWGSKTIDELCIINPESWTKESAPDFVNYVDLANAKHGTVGETIEYSFSEAPSRARRILHPHDTIIGVVRPANRSYAYVHEEGVTGSTGFAVVRSNNENYRAFVYFTLTNDDCIQKFTRIADGAAYPAIKLEDVAKVDCIFSNEIVLEKFEHIVGELMKKVAANELQIKPLTKLRDTLLPKLISGELITPELENCNG